MVGHPAAWGRRPLLLLQRPWARAAAACLDPGRLANATGIAAASYGLFGANGAVKNQAGVDALGGHLVIYVHPGFRR